MSLVWLTLLTLFFPIIPWVAWAPYGLVGLRRASWLAALFAAGIILDLWWGKPLGLTAAVLLIILIGSEVLAKIWPASRRTLSIVALLGALVIFETYLIL